jgi:Bacterial RNA polymerase, alpha chain C terminal domain
MASSGSSYNVPIEELCLTVRCYIALKRDGIDTVGQLVMLPERRVRKLKNVPPGTMDELRGKLHQLGLSPWDAPRPACQGGSRTARRVRDPRRPGWLSRRALGLAGALLPAAERHRWVEEWEGELWALASPKARARFIVSLLLTGRSKLAVTLRHVWPGEKPRWPSS